MKYLISAILFLTALHEKITKALVSLLYKACNGWWQLLLYLVPALTLAFLIGVYTVFGGILVTFLKTLFLVRRNIDELTENH